jgi:DNA-binding CsgD family transcriptional regulator
MSTLTLSGIGALPTLELPVRAGGAPAEDRQARVYRYALRHAGIPSVAMAAAELGLSVPDVIAAVTGLVELHLLRTDGERLVPVDPDLAAASLITPIERGMYERRDLADRLRERIDGITRTEAEPATPVGAIDGLTGVAEIRGLFRVTAEVCRQELVVLRPGHDDEALLDELLEPVFSVLERDVPVRLVGPHRSRAGFASRATAKRLVDSGAQIRTVSQVPHAAVVFDRTLAVMLSESAPGEPPTARRVRDGNVVQFLVDLFDQLWEGATPFASEEPGYADALDDLQQSILRLMAQGLTDEVVARRLGMSVRTCRRHIAALLQNLGSVSRFQAGVQAAHRFTLSGGRTA